MVSVRFAGLCAAAVAAALVAAGPGSALASITIPSSGPNYTFPDGSAGFSFLTQGGVINPGVLVGFNPQPDPPGTPPTLVQMLNPETPLFGNATGGAYQLELAFVGFGPGQITTPPAPDTDGRSSFQFLLGGQQFDVTLQFGPGPVDPGSWVGFNPQPDPPGDVVGADFSFAADPDMTLSITENGQALTLSPAPEPGAWALMFGGLALAGAGLRRRRSGGVLTA